MERFHLSHRWASLCLDLSTVTFTIAHLHHVKHVNCVFLMDLPCNGIAFFLENLHWFVVDTVWSKLSLTAAMTHPHACNSPSTFSCNINERLCITFNINLILIKAITSKESSQPSYSATALICLRRLRTCELFMRSNGLEILCTLIFLINKFIIAILPWCSGKLPIFVIAAHGI